MTLLFQIDDELRELGCIPKLLMPEAFGGMLLLVREVNQPPHGYRDRKPRGWRWRAPWSHEDDNKLPLVMFIVAVAALVSIFFHLSEITPLWLFLGTIAIAAPAGAMLVLWLRD